MSNRYIFPRWTTLINLQKQQSLHKLSYPFWYFVYTLSNFSTINTRVTVWISYWLWDKILQIQNTLHCIVSFCLRFLFQSFYVLILGNFFSKVEEITKKSLIYFIHSKVFGTLVQFFFNIIVFFMLCNAKSLWTFFLSLNSRVSK